MPPPVPGHVASMPPKPVPQPPTASPDELYELAVTSAAMGFHQSALEALREATERAPDHVDAWRKLAQFLRLAAKDEEAAAARAKADRIGENSTKWPKATGERSPTKIGKAERRLDELLYKTPPDKHLAVLRNRLFRDPLDVVSMRKLAQYEFREDDVVTCQNLLERALDLSPGYTGARCDYANLLQERRQYVQAASEAQRLLVQAPRDLDYRGIRAFALAQTGRFAEAIDVLEGMVKDKPDVARYWLSYANCLHFVGRRDESILAYRKTLTILPTSGEAYWGLAVLKGNALTDEDVAAMRGHLTSGRLDLSGGWHMSYALAHALERAKDFAGSFHALEEGARAFRENFAETRHAHDPEAAAERVRRLKQVFSAENLSARVVPISDPPPRDTPIFVVGMPRAGSTLLEQILASHSMVEGTRELPVMGDITRELTHSRCLVTPVAYPECVLDLTPEELAALGERYIRNASVYRYSDRPYFVDKRPWNWMDAGLIHLMLPHAKIIDIRRAPMSACFAMFKQLLPVDAAFTYDLNHLGRYYNEYVGMMEHYEEVLPGRIHYLSYERLVEDTETEVRRLLEYCGLPFEEGCLRFYETDRAVVTPSAEQVRTPIFRDAMQQWRNFEPWLGPLKAALEVS
jgi:tetratricopeptide (TPR) repeat protein